MSRAFLKPRYCAASTTICWRPAIIERGVNDFLDRCFTFVAYLAPFRHPLSVNA